MISFVRGTVAHAGADQLVVDLGSVGITVQCTPGTALSVRAGEHVELMTTMVVREDGWTLFGFTDPDERTVFEQVQTVTGIGPRIAMALLGTLSPDELRRAVASSDEAALTKVPGIGRKGAQRLILELADRLGPLPVAVVGDRASSSTAAPGDGSRRWRRGSRRSAGRRAEADAAVAAIDPALAAEATAAGGSADVGALLKAALRGLDRS